MDTFIEGVANSRGDFFKKSSTGAQGGGKFEGGLVAIRAGTIFSGKLVGGAVIRTGAEEGEAPGEVDSFVEGEELERDESLIVVGAEDGVEFSVGGAMVNGVGGPGAGEDSWRFGLKDFESGGEEGDFFGTEIAILPCVGIDASEGNLGPRNSACVTECKEMAGGAEETVGGEGGRNLGKGDVDSCQPDSKRPAGQDHGEIPDSSAVSEEFGLPGEGESDGVEVVFRDGAGDKGVNGTSEGEVGGFLQGGDGEAGGFRSGAARVDAFAGADGEQLDAGAGKSVLRGAGDFRTDAGGVAHGQSDAPGFHQTRILMKAALRRVSSQRSAAFWRSS